MESKKKYIYFLCNSDKTIIDKYELIIDEKALIALQESINVGCSCILEYKGDISYIYEYVKYNHLVIDEIGKEKYLLYDYPYLSYLISCLLEGNIDLLNDIISISNNPFGMSNEITITEKKNYHRSNINEKGLKDCLFISRDTNNCTDVFDEYKKALSYITFIYRGSESVDDLLQINEMLDDVETKKDLKKMKYKNKPLNTICENLIKFFESKNLSVTSNKVIINEDIDRKLIRKR